MNDTPITNTYTRWGDLQGCEIVEAAVARALERRVNRLTDTLTKCRERVKYQEPKIVIMEEIDQALADSRLIHDQIMQEYRDEIEKERARRIAAGDE